MLSFADKKFLTIGCYEINFKWQELRLITRNSFEIKHVYELNNKLIVISHINYGPGGFEMTNSEESAVAVITKQNYALPVKHYALCFDDGKLLDEKLFKSHDGLTFIKDKKNIPQLDDAHQLANHYPFSR